jgi:hypothetical protein
VVLAPHVVVGKDVRQIVGGVLSPEQIEVLKGCALDREAKEYFERRFNVSLQLV